MTTKLRTESRPVGLWDSRCARILAGKSQRPSSAARVQFLRGPSYQIRNFSKILPASTLNRYQSTYLRPHLQESLSPNPLQRKLFPTRTPPQSKSTRFPLIHPHLNPMRLTHFNNNPIKKRIRKSFGTGTNRIRLCHHKRDHQFRHLM